MSSKPSYRTRGAWAAWFIFANGAIATLVGLRFLPWMSIPDGATAFYVTLLMPGQFPLLAWLAGLPLFLLALLLPARRTLTALAVVYGAALTGLLALDTVAYSLYRFHLSGFVLELALSGGAQIFDFSWQVWATAAALFLAVILVQAGIAALLWRHRPRGRWLAAAFFSLFALQLSAHGWHAWADANYDSRITGISRHIPLYYGATAKRFMDRHGLVDQQKAREHQDLQSLANSDAGGQLNYPTAPLECGQPERELNLLVVVIDGARGDMLDPRWMPNLHRFAGSSLNFEQHYSNGNATKPGLFTLFYSLPASYWDAFTAAKQPPVVISRMQELDYQLQVLGSATLVSPAFDQNVFASVPGLRLETPGEESWDRDIRITDDWLDFVATGRQPDRPFFGFLFYDTPHNHRVPDDYPVKFQPFWESVNKLELNQDFNPELIRNNYKSTLHLVDNQIGRVLDDLRERGLLDTTVVMITGDHGQEFNDHGLNYWGHGSNFGPYQLRVPMVVHWPGQPADNILYRTEHFGVAPTLMSRLLGCEATPHHTYATGNGLFSPRERNWSIAHSYMDYALLMDDFSVVTYASGNVDILGSGLEPLNNVRLNPSTTVEVLKELSRFYE